jgi:GNAT superfamily N-acetyltransferase
VVTEISVKKDHFLSQIARRIAMEINIRVWRASDSEKILASWLEFCRNAARSDMRLKPDSVRVLREWLHSRLREPSTIGFVAEKDGTYAGFLIGRIDEWESSPPVLEPRKMGIIDAVYVDEQFRRTGIGARLVHHAIQVMHERNAVAVETTYEAWSDASAALWRKAGFAPWMVHAYRTL